MLIMAFQPERGTPRWLSRMVVVELGRDVKYPPDMWFRRAGGD